jgi:CHAD domain-containing protein
LIRVEAPAYGQQPDERKRMHKKLMEVTAAIELASAALRQGYQVEQLYALRVAMRRLRSMLKPIGSTRSRRFRKTWGGFATVTNRARDWDVFLLAACDVLSAAQYAAFERRHAGDIGACREAVIELVHSTHWRRELNDWQQYLQHPNGGEHESAQAVDPLQQALGRARAALAAALELNDERSWHKLRIAVKEVRYQAESEEDGPMPDRARAELLEQCKVLQSLLGGWHDSVVQLQMLEQFEAAPEHAALQAAIGERRIQRLAEIERTVAGHPLFNSAGNS